MKSMKDSGGVISNWFRHLVQPNIWNDVLTEDQRKVLKADPFNIHPDKALFAKKQRKDNVLEKRRDGLRKFQAKYSCVNEDEVGVGVHPPKYNSGNMILPSDELSLGSSIAKDLWNYRGGKEVDEMMLAIPRIQTYGVWY